MAGQRQADGVCRLLPLDLTCSAYCVIPDRSHKIIEFFWTLGGRTPACVRKGERECERKTALWHRKNGPSCREARRRERLAALWGWVAPWGGLSLPSTAHLPLSSEVVLASCKAAPDVARLWERCWLTGNIVFNSLRRSVSCFFPHHRFEPL